MLGIEANWQQFIIVSDLRWVAGIINNGRSKTDRWRRHNASGERSEREP
jgi:hypothetical protein